MVKNVFKKAMKRVIAGARSYIARLEEEPKEEHDYDQDDTAYPWLNSMFTKLLIEGGGALRQSYTWGVLHGVHLAKALGINRVSVIEFGVAGGNSLVSLEKIAEKAEEIFGVSIDVFGFDTGSGLPAPQDYRDLPNLVSEGLFPMDIERLQRRLKRAHLIMGHIGATLSSFIEGKPSPVAFVSFDLDLYSSTMQAFKLLDADQDVLLPRIECYFDDTMECSDYTGERLAISEFNASHKMRKISKNYGTKYIVPPRYANKLWVELFYVAHIFDHRLYGRPDGIIKRAALDLRD